MSARSTWAGLPAEHRSWLVINALALTALINLVINATIAWLSVRGQSTVPLWSRPLSQTSVLGDTLGTLFLLPLITCLLCTTAVWRDLRIGTLAPLDPASLGPRWLRRTPPTRMPRAIAFGALTFVALGAPVTVALAAIDLDDLTGAQFVLFKTAFAVVLGAVVTPLIALRAMSGRRG